MKWKEWRIRKGVERQISDTSLEATLDGMIESGADDAKVHDKPALPIYKFSSDLRQAIAYLIRTKPDVSDREILAYLRKNHPMLIPASWKEDEKLAGDTFTKVRRVLRQNASTAICPPLEEKQR